MRIYSQKYANILTILFHHNLSAVSLNFNFSDPETALSNPSKPDSSLKRSVPIRPKESKDLFILITMNRSNR